MPAVTVDDILTVPAVASPAMSESQDRSLLSLTTAPSGYEGEGFPVRRAFAGVDLRMLDPFIHMDQMGEVEYAPGEPKGTPWHPHRGFETVTVVRRGLVDHADSMGAAGRYGQGDVQWLTTGSGIMHSEMFPLVDDVRPNPLELFQIWIQPRHRGLTPRWAQRTFPSGERAGTLVPLASGREGDAEALPIDQDSALLGATLAAGQTVVHTLAPGRQAHGRAMS